MTAIVPHMETYLRDYLTKQKGASHYTCETYACSFQLLFNFASQRLKIPPSSMTLEQIDALLITDFLEYLEETKGNTASTRNTRLAAIKSFFHFLDNNLLFSKKNGIYITYYITVLIRQKVSDSFTM